MLESFADSMGAWRFMDVLGKSAMELEDELMSDLLTWRWIAGIVREQNRMIEKGEDPFLAAPAMSFDSVTK